MNVGDKIRFLRSRGSNIHDGEIGEIVRIEGPSVTIEVDKTQGGTRTVIGGRIFAKGIATVSMMEIRSATPPADPLKRVQWNAKTIELVSD